MGLSSACGFKVSFPFDEPFLFQKLQVLGHCVHAHLQGSGDPLLGYGAAFIDKVVDFALIYFFDFHCGHACCIHKSSSRGISVSILVWTGGNDKWGFKTKGAEKGETVSGNGRLQHFG